MTKIQELAEKAKGFIRVNARHEVIFEIIDELAGVAEVPQVFYSGVEFPPAKDEDGCSENVLIDLNGWRRDFRVGWYDHNNKQWMFHVDDISVLELDHMTWTYLPLNKEKQ